MLFQSNVSMGKGNHDSNLIRIQSWRYPSHLKVCLNSNSTDSGPKPWHLPFTNSFTRQVKYFLTNVNFELLQEIVLRSFLIKPLGKHGNKTPRLYASLQLKIQPPSSSSFSIATSVFCLHNKASPQIHIDPPMMKSNNALDLLSCDLIAITEEKISWTKCYDNITINMEHKKCSQQSLDVWGWNLNRE